MAIAPISAATRATHEIGAPRMPTALLASKSRSGTSPLTSMFIPPQDQARGSMHEPMIASRFPRDLDARMAPPPGARHALKHGWPRFRLGIVRHQHHV